MTAAVLVPQADHLLLDTVAVAPDGQGQGVGTRLLELADAQARRLGDGRFHRVFFRKLLPGPDRGMVGG